jgi:serine/threonine protein kinase
MNVSHPNIHQLIAVKMKAESGKFSIISEMMTNGNILKYIKKTKANRIYLVRFSVIASLLGRNHSSNPQLEDVAKGLEYLHKSGIIHGDLKGVR